tara:strand:- start:853 stop:1095 length:243 start_codon:yes stop_codon:yes gene_type:complete
MKTIIHVNQHRIRANVKNNTSDPVLTVKTYRTNEYASEVLILGKDGEEAARIIYRPHKPLSCGARCWLEVPDHNQISIED